jgi:hypothetical protein
VSGRLRGSGDRARLARFLDSRLTEDTIDALAADDLVPERAEHPELGPARGFWDRPERMFREITAKRALIRLWQRAGGDIGARVGAGLLEDVVREIATVYADHADFDPAWTRPGLDVEPSAPVRGSGGSAPDQPQREARILPLPLGRRARRR